MQIFSLGDFILFSGKNKKIISNCSLLKFLPSMVGIKYLKLLLHKHFFYSWLVTAEQETTTCLYNS